MSVLGSYDCRRVIVWVIRVSVLGTSCECLRVCHMSA